MLPTSKMLIVLFFLVGTVGGSSTQPAGTGPADSATPTSGGTFHFDSPDGYSFDYLNGWEVMTKEEQNAIDTLTKMRGKDFSKQFRDCSSIFFRKDALDAEFTPISFIVLERGNKIVVDAALKEKMQTEVPPAYRAKGFSVNDFEITTIRVAGRDAISMHFNGTLPDDKQPIRFWLVIVPGEKNILSIGSIAAKADFSANEPAFKTIIDTFSIKDDNWFLGIFEQFGTRALIGGVVTAGIALILALVRKRRQRNASPGESPPPLESVTPAGATAAWNDPTLQPSPLPIAPGLDEANNSPAQQKPPPLPLK